MISVSVASERFLPPSHSSLYHQHNRFSVAAALLLRDLLEFLRNLSDQTSPRKISYATKLHEHSVNDHLSAYSINLSHNPGS